MKIHKNDKVKIMVGKDTGKEGVVEKVNVTHNTVLIAGANLFKRHMKPRQEGQKGQIVDVPRPLPAANVALICPKCKMVTRVGYQINGKEKMRVCKKCRMSL